MKNLGDPPNHGKRNKRVPDTCAFLQNMENPVDIAPVVPKVRRGHREIKFPHHRVQLVAGNELVLFFDAWITHLISHSPRVKLDTAAENDHGTSGRNAHR
jgi:hypothetical protein